MTADPQQEFLGLVNDLLRHVQHQKEEGVRSIEVDPSKLGTGPARVRAEPPPAVFHTPSPQPAGTSDAAAALADIARRVAACTTCPLSRSRTRTVPGQGATAPEIMFVGEGPGYDEDQQGLAFVGRAGQLLTKIIEAMGLRREDVFIGNIVKCRPPGNRTPLPDEMQACLPYLKEQIAILKPKVIIALGATAVRGLLDVTTGITRLRGQWLLYEGIDVMPTYHPAYLLRSPAGKKDVWDDMQAVLARLGRKPPVRKNKSDQ